MDNASVNGGGPDLADLLSKFASTENGQPDEQGLQDALELMMGHLMSKELLYDPMADLNSNVRII